jgi:hypothetical protein
MAPNSTSGTPAPGYTYGFPFVRAWVAENVVLGTGDSLPAMVQIKDYWVYSTLRRFCAMQHQSQVQEFQTLETNALIDLQNQINGIMERDPIKIVITKPRMLRL